MGAPPQRLTYSVKCDMLVCSMSEFASSIGSSPENSGKNQARNVHPRGRGRFGWIGVAAATLFAIACVHTVEAPQAEEPQADMNIAYPELLTLSNFNPRLGFTAEAWIKPSKPDFAGYIVSKMGSTQNGFSVFVHSFPSEQIQGAYVVNYEFGVVNDGNNCAYHRVSQQRNLPESEVTSWQHVAGVIQPNGALEIFVNGERSTDHRNSITGVCPRDLPINIGARQLSDGVDGVFSGLIDARLSDAARYPGNFPASRDPFSRDANTVALYSTNGQKN